MTGRAPATESTEVVSQKRVAKDGTQRGLSRKGKKNKVHMLIERMQHAVEMDTGIGDWDPVVQMAVVVARAHAGYLATDEKNNPILDADGNQVVIPPNPELAVAAAAKVAPYIHQTLRPRDSGEEQTEDDPDETRDKVLSAFEQMGVTITDG